MVRLKFYKLNAFVPWLLYKRVFDWTNKQTV